MNSRNAYGRPPDSPTGADEAGINMIDMQVHGAKVHALQVIHALALEISTRMKLSSKGSVLAVANRITGRKDRYKLRGLISMVEHMHTLDPSWEPSDRIKRALISK